jgi:hypothetical protein
MNSAIAHYVVGYCERSPLQTKHSSPDPDPKPSDRYVLALAMTPNHAVFSYRRHRILGDAESDVYLHRLLPELRMHPETDHDCSILCKKTIKISLYGGHASAPAVVESSNYLLD